MQQNKNLTGTALGQAVNGQSWDPSVKALTQFPSVLHNLAQNLAWTSQLGEAYHNQASDVMAAVQTLRAQAKAAGNLKSTPQQTVATQSQGGTQVIVIQPANPQVVYVPEYNPTVVYGTPYTAPGYSTGDLVATGLLSFGAGMAVGAMMSGGCCGWGYSSWNCNWHGGGVYYGGHPYYGNSAWHGGYYGNGYDHNNRYNNGYNRNGYHANNYNRNTNVNRNTVNVNNADRQNVSADRSDASARGMGQQRKWPRCNSFQRLWRSLRRRGLEEPGGQFSWLGKPWRGRRLGRRRPQLRRRRVPRWWPEMSLEENVVVQQKTRPSTMKEDVGRMKMSHVKIMILRGCMGLALLALVISFASCNKSEKPAATEVVAEDICVSG